jgi:monoamine oxidase
MRCDAVVVGAGLAGLSAARDLARGGADVVLLEARGRVGGRVEQTELADGRRVQLGGEVVGEFHTAYLELVGELGLTTTLAFGALPGADTWVMADGTFVGNGYPWMDDEDRASYDRASEAFARLARTVDPDDPWSHPDAARLDAVSVGQWLRSEGATPNAIRARDVAMLSLSAESLERTSLLADLRKEAAAGAHGFYDYEVWESLRVAEGSASVALRMGEELGPRVRTGTPVARVDVASPRCTVVTELGERFECEIVVMAVPAGPLRQMAIEGVSPERLRSLRRQRHALAAKAVYVYDRSFWHDAGQNGSSYHEVAIQGGTWEQQEGILSALIPPERLASLLAFAPEHAQEQLTAEVVAAYGPQAAAPDQMYVRRWGVDPWTQGYITAWRPGEVMGVGPLHNTHEPPFYVCGSDKWVAGYMEGAVRTGRGAARAALAGSGERTSAVG